MFTDEVAMAAYDGTTEVHLLPPIPETSTPAPVAFSSAVESDDPLAVVILTFNPACVPKELVDGQTDNNKWAAKEWLMK